ncbi:MAG: glycine--tRNA ligase subunit beta [Terriglobales bacterium]
MPDFLLEVGTEEIPARMIDGAQAELAQRVSDLIVRERLAEKPEVTPFSTPRRLAVIARGIRASQADVEEEMHGPASSVAAKNPKAAEAFAKKAGVPLGQLQKVTTPKGEYLAAKIVRKGRTAAEILAEALPGEVLALYWAKTMYWRIKSERWVRPVRWLVALLDGEIVPLEIGGIVAGAESRGHRQLSSGPVAIKRASDYQEALAKAKVLGKEEREAVIRKALDAAVRTIPGARWREDKGNLNTVVNLTEWPSVLLGSYDREFLALPEEVLVTVMRDHQKYFAVDDASGKLAPYFLTVLNREGDPEGIIRHGNERVLRARFRDARFFWDNDQKTPLKQRVQMLKNVTFQKDLGSYYDKGQRMIALVGKATDLEKKGVRFNKAAAVEAARLSKTDLTTDMVKEFTELQGVVGGLYAKAQGLGATIADAIYDQYKPQSMEDAAPRTVEGAIVSIADKADSIAGMFALGLVPSGSKDPFALRRQANGIVKTIAEHKLPVSLSQLFKQAREGYKGSEAERSFDKKLDFSGAIAAFFRERLEFYLRDVLGFAYDVVNAVLAAGADDILDAVLRAEAVTKVRPSEDFESISIAFKRMKNILRQAQEAKKWNPADAAGGFAKLAQSSEPAEQVLQQASAAAAAKVKKLRGSNEYEQALTEISKLRKPLDTFFDKVMVMVDDAKVRKNRLALLQTILNEFSTIADFSEIVTEKK